MYSLIPTWRAENEPVLVEVGDKQVAEWVAVVTLMYPVMTSPVALQLDVEVKVPFDETPEANDTVAEVKIHGQIRQTLRVEPTLSFLDSHLGNFAALGSWGLVVGTGDESLQLEMASLEGQTGRSVECVDQVHHLE